MKEALKKLSLGGLVAAAMFCSASVQAEEAKAEPSVSASVDVPVLSAYVWRGQVLNDEAVLQPTFNVGKNGFSMFWWGSMDLTDQITGDEYEFSEHDVGISYSATCPVTGANVTLGVVNYDFPNQGIPVGDGHEGHVSLINDTRELQLTAAFSEVVLAPTLFLAYDFKEADSLYANFGVSHSIEISKDQASAVLAASIGYGLNDYNEFYFGSHQDAFNDANFSLTVPIKVCPNATITPGIQYTMLVDSEIEDNADLLYYDKDQVVGSLKATYAF